MYERQAAELFEQGVASLLAGSRPLVEAPDQDFRERVQLAEQLVALDIAAESRVREPLRGRVTGALQARRASAGARVRHQPWVVRRSVLAAGLGVALAVALLAIVAPRSMAAFVEPVFQIIDEFRVGDHTRIIRMASQKAAEIVVILERHKQELANGRSWYLQTDYGGFGGGVPAGEKAIVQRVASFQMLRSLTALRLQLPTHFYRGEAIRFDHAYVAPDGAVFLFFGSGRREVFLALFPVGGGRTVGFGRTVGRTTSDGGMVSESPELKTEDLSLDGRAVVWDPDTTGLNRDLSALRWEADGVSYSLMGRSLTREEAGDLFLSLRPVE